jgi:hypothetical protein
MTAPAAAPTSGPVAPAAPRATPQPPTDRYAFAAMLDSLPGAPTKAGASTAEEPAHTSNEAPQDESSHGQASHHSALNDSTLVASLPFALRVGAMMDERAQAADNPPSPSSPAMKGPKSDDSGASVPAGAKTPVVGRLIGERAFHSAASTTNFMPQVDLKGESVPAAGFARDQAMPANPPPGAVPAIASATAPAPIAPRTGAPQSNRASLTRAAAHVSAQNGQKPLSSAPPPVIRDPSPASPVAPAESSAKTADIHLPDSTLSAGPAVAQTGPFGALSLTAFVAGAAFEPEASPRGVDTDLAAPASARDGRAPSTSPVREIDVDLSPGGLEDVSMTMRLTGDKLSVVIRATSSQTLGSIEGARDAIADRMAAIGQPLDSLIVKQAGVNIDGNANGNGSSADGGSGGGEQRSAQASGERGGSNDASLSRRGAGRDRSF